LLRTVGFLTETQSIPVWSGVSLLDQKSNNTAFLNYLMLGIM